MANYIGTRINVLDKGHVTLVDHLGDDSSIVQAARVCYGEGTVSMRNDKSLIRYLMRHEHTSPFEFVEFVFHMKLPIFVARQIVRHRTCSLSEVSGRYSKIKDEAYLPKEIRKQSKSNKQSSYGKIDDIPEDLTLSMMKWEQSQAFENYNYYLDNGACREQARINIPLASYTEWYWKMDLKNLLHFIKLRIDKHAQEETRAYGQAVYDLIKPYVPFTVEAFEDYVINSIKLSSTELNFLLTNNIINIAELMNINFDGAEKISKSELRELKEKFGVGDVNE